ncbi:LOW QUALITY PROTEIN: protocadherin gamma-A6-like [Neosynchiropus ocellatus]
MVGGQIRYSIPEEMKKGSVIGNVAQDLGLDVRRLRSGRARIVTGENIQYTELKTDKGLLVVNERIDREQLCGDVTPCSFSFEMILENPMELHQITIEVLDINDHAPVFENMNKALTFEISEAAAIGTEFPLQSAPISEDSPPGTTIAIFNIKDSDSAENGQVKCSVDATDSGNPPLTTSKILHLKISDVNDNPPVFDRNKYSAHISENNSPGVSIFAVSAHDSDLNQNARISYILEDTEVSGAPVSTFVSLNSESGVISAVRTFDYEQIKELQLTVKAQDGGSPPLSSNVTVKILIQDQNDNPPQVLYPVQTGGSLVAEMVPRSADVGYLVTKVVAVDVDSGQNAWLSYKLQRATDRPLFEVGLQNGEIRTIRQVTDKDAVKQRLSVTVEDNGQPSRSATVIVNVAVADSFPEVMSEFTDFTQDKEYNDNLTFYLVLALAVVSFLFITCLVVIISVKIYRWRQSRVLYHSNLPVIPYYPPRYSDSGDRDSPACVQLRGVQDH